jgi:hypothetical protein
MNVPLDSDGFMRRECPNCEQRFKWRPSQDNDPEPQETVNHYYCPLCGQASGPDSWWTPEQLEHAKAALMPEAMRQIQDAFGDAFRSNRHVRFEASSDLGNMPVPEALHEPDDMVIVEPPCHIEEPVKVPEDVQAPLHCLICGEPFAT